MCNIPVTTTRYGIHLLLMNMLAILHGLNHRLLLLQSISLRKASTISLIVGFIEGLIVWMDLMRLPVFLDRFTS
jgi:hypothetical protein